MKLIKPYYEIESEIDSEKILRHLEKAARTCYKSEHKISDFETTKKFIRSIINRGHESTIEHYSLSVRIICSRSFTHELVRHRLCAFSQESTRYCNYSKDEFGNNLTFIIPPWVNIPEGEYTSIEKIPEDFTKQEQYWFETMLVIERTYKFLIDHGWSAQQARMVLPNSLKTEIVITANLREFRHIFNLRTSKAAHPEMREVMIPLLKEFKKKIPVLFDEFDG